jgi:hypothetical protein
MNKMTRIIASGTGLEPPVKMPPLVAAYFITAITWLVLGIGIGIYMSVSENFLLRPVHAHVNLLGWVTNALFGCFFWLRGGRSRRREWMGFIMFNAGALLLLVGLTALLNGITGVKPVMPIGTVLVALGIVQMVAVIVANSMPTPAIAE